MSDLGTYLYQYLAERFSDQDWSEGSIIRELVAEPIVALVSQATAALNGLYSSMDIQALLADPETNSDSIDTLFQSLGLETPEPTEASGSVRLLISSGEDFELADGTTFTFEDTALIVPNTYNIKTIPETPADLRLTQVGLNSFEVIVPVTVSMGGTTIYTGTELTWPGSSIPIYSATVYETITGGVGEYTATQKINLIRQTLFPQSLNCREGLIKALNSLQAESVVDGMFQHSLQPGATDFCVKTTSAPTTWRTTVKATRTSPGMYVAQLDGDGVSAILSVNNVPPLKVERNGRRLTVNFQTTSDSGTLNVECELIGLKELKPLQDLLDNYCANTGVVLNLGTPRLLMLSAYLPVGDDTLLPDIKVQLTSAVNNSLLNAGSLGDSTFTSILNKYQIRLQAPGSYTLTDVLTGKSKTGIGAINPATFYGSSQPIAIYTAMDQLT